MAAKRFEKGSEEWNMFKDFWKLCQQHWEPDETEEYWQGLIDDINSFYKKNKTPFARKLYWALYKEVEEKLKKKNG